MERVGLGTIKAVLENREERETLAGRIEETLSRTTDPWKEIIETESLRKNFEPLASVQPVIG
ncbi:Nitrite reductase [NAD(P)H] [compost metagenome]